MEIEELITIIIAILIAVVIFRVFMWLLPVVVVLAIAYVIYRYLGEKYLISPYFFYFFSNFSKNTLFLFKK